MSLPISFDLRNLYVPNTSQVDYPATYLDLEILRDALNNFAGVFSSAFFVATDGSANVGMGTDAPVSALDIRRSFGGTVVVSASGTRYGFMQWVEGEGRFRVATDGNFPLSLEAAANERMRIKPTGQVRLIPLGSTPGSLEDGDIWYDVAAGKFRGRAAGVTVDLH